ncbi:hypothetical protein K504DRAFT_494999 [Pleomassaria siparia CBS 279.74]|uniref:Uncharacterized protein n=1 Tax=Pleomassaria siparia CBS 279.74 TaxID=1314801 RepID=A0A6G1JVA8_9PLEO|nr:hypothetical protein K504DRAFT_494999 [Pleomassaria siparia CBS 279.74]
MYFVYTDGEVVHGNESGVGQKRVPVPVARRKVGWILCKRELICWRGRAIVVVMHVAHREPVASAFRETFKVFAYRRGPKHRQRQRQCNGNGNGNGNSGLRHHVRDIGSYCIGGCTKEYKGTVICDMWKNAKPRKKKGVGSGGARMTGSNDEDDV